jgi:hypothetical protein
MILVHVKIYIVNYKELLLPLLDFGSCKKYIVNYKELLLVVLDFYAPYK